MCASMPTIVNPFEPLQPYRVYICDNISCFRTRKVSYSYCWKWYCPWGDCAADWIGSARTWRPTCRSAQAYLKTCDSSFWGAGPSSRSCHSWRHKDYPRTYFRLPQERSAELSSWTAAWLQRIRFTGNIGMLRKFRVILVAGGEGKDLFGHVLLRLV